MQLGIAQSIALKELGVVLDRRILTKQYGIAFLDALPECKRYRGTTANLPWIAKRWIDGEEGK